MDKKKTIKKPRIPVAKPGHRINSKKDYDRSRQTPPEEELENH